ncbi:MAG: type II secretion system F family protein [Candidatus Saccharimonadales bacterium]|jgi:type IV pilus assembly protein PilC|nr:type pilus assembly protein PilC [Patescibacteria group bacterium]
MPAFSYTAISQNGDHLNGYVEAPDRAAVIKSLTSQNLRPISIKESNSGTPKPLLRIFAGGRVKNDELVILTRELSAMVGAGVPLLKALTSLHDHAESKNLKTILTSIIKDVEGGDQLADALAKYPGTFNDVYVNMVRAGETAGILDDILKRLAYQQEKNATIRKKIKSAMTYPMVLVGITVLAFFGLMLFVIPQIGKILEGLGGPDAKLPGLTLAMLALSDFFIKAWYIIFPVIGIGIFFLLRFLKTPSGKLLLHSSVLKIPVLKTIIIKIAVARFSRTFSALIGAGVPVLEALSVTGRAVGNVVYENALLEASKAVESGSTLSSEIEKNPLFPAIVSQMLSVGEETGQTDTVLVKVADFYEEEVDVAIEGISSIIEPVMIVFMGGMIGLIAASVMMPIASLSSSIK